MESIAVVPQAVRFATNYAFENKKASSLRLRLFYFQNGGASETTGALAQSNDNYHDIIRFSPRTKDSIFEECLPFYEKGCSLREIERQTGIPKSTIRDTFRLRGYPLRRSKPVQTTQHKKPDAMQSGAIPYGYAYLEGQLVKDPAEFNVVLKIIKLWESGKSLTAIAEILNNQKVPTRLGKNWVHSVIGAIVKRHSELKKEPS